MLAAADDVTRQRCMRIIQAASAGASPLQDMASAAALTRDLLDMKSLPALQAVFAALRCSWADIKSAGFTMAEVKAAGCDAASAKAAGHEEDLLLAVFGLEAMIYSGCNLSFILVSCSTAHVHTHTQKLDFQPSFLNRRRCQCHSITTTTTTFTICFDTFLITPFSAMAPTFT